MILSRLASAVLLSGIVLLASATPALADGPSERAVPAASIVEAGVDDFSFARMDVAYELGRDESGRSTLHTVEELVAVFPDFDQNRGIRRAIPQLYDGHSTYLTIVSVTDETGAARDYVTAVDGDFLVLTIAVPPGQFVHGEQHYVIEYTQRDVTKFFEDTNDDEFYWDINGTGWAQPFGTVSATVELDAALAPLATEASCYRGPEFSTERCPADLNGSTLTISESDLGPYQNVTLVLAFPAGTFAAAPFNLFTFVPWPAVFGVGAGLAALILAVVARIFLIRDAKGRGLVIAQYEPPANLPIPLAAELLGRPNKAFSALIVNEAVHGRLRIVERPGRWSSPDFGLQNLSAGHSPDPYARSIVTAIFFGPRLSTASLWSGFGGAQTEPDAEGVRWLSKNDSFLGRHVQSLVAEARSQALTGGLRRKPPSWPRNLVVALNVIAMLLLIAILIFDQSEIAIVIGVLGLNLIPWLGIASVGLVAAKRPLTSNGAELKEQLDGLKLFIGWAEADRLRMLQSVDGAERSPLDPTPGSPDAARIVDIYEKLLPYAVLFGQEKQWAAELSKYYATETPGWYSGSSSTFNAAMFATSMSSFSSSTSSSYSGSSSSSSSGGSGGGGSSGGGGGGGGGGGV